MRADLSLVWQGWWQLSAERRRDQGEPLRITSLEMVTALDLFQVTDPETRADWCAWWRDDMESAFFAYVAERREVQANANAVPGTEP